MFSKKFHNWEVKFAPIGLIPFVILITLIWQNPAEMMKTTSFWIQSLSVLTFIGIPFFITLSFIGLYKNIFISHYRRDGLRWFIIIIYMIASIILSLFFLTALALGALVNII